MINNESELASNMNTLHECGEKGPWSASSDNACEAAFQEVMDFMKKDGPLQDSLKSRDLLKIEGNSLTFSPNLYRSEKK